MHTLEAVGESDRLAAGQGDAGAQARLGQAHYLGLGVVQDFQEAVRWARLAAEQNSALGQGVLAAAYNTGSGVAQDFAEALRWARLAADQGDARGQTVLASLYRGGRGVAQDFEEAVRSGKPRPRRVTGVGDPYSKRTILIGSTRVARRAGGQQAASATAASTSGASRNVSGSSVATP